MRALIPYLLLAIFPVQGATIAYWNSQTGGTTLTDLAGGDQNLVGGGGGLGSSALNIAPFPVPNPDSLTSGANGSIYFGSAESPHIDAAGAFQMTGSSSFTMEGWMRVDADTTTRYIASDRHQGNSYRGWFVNILSDNRLMFYSNSGGTATQIISSSAIADGTDHHFAAVWDHVNGEMSLYVDGTLQGTLSHSVGSYSVYGFSIGGRDGTGGGGAFTDNRLTDSRLDELRFSDQALNSSEFLNAVPEPSAALLALLGLIPLLRRRR